MNKSDAVSRFLDRFDATKLPSKKLINGLMDIPYNHVEVMRIGRPVRGSHAKTKKYLNRRNKERPPVNPGDRCAGYFSLEAQSLDVMKKLVTKKVHSKEHLINYCEEQTRFQYYYTVRNMAFAKRHATKKPVGEKQTSFLCHLCDEYFPTEQDIEAHDDTNTHFEIKMVFDRLLEVFIEWYEAKLDPDYSLSSTAVQAEVEGIKIKTGKVRNLPPRVDGEEVQIKRDREKQREVHRDKAKFQVSNDIFSEVDARRLTLEQFILASYDKVMEVHWPTPQTKFYCRCCNYESFETDELLNAHKKTEEHLERKSKFMEAWCVSCQIHTGNANGYEAHLKTPRHKMIKQLLDDTNKRAVAFWNKVNDTYMMAARNSADQFYDPYMLPAFVPFHGPCVNASLYYPPGSTMETNWVTTNGDPPVKKPNLNDVQNINNKSHPYYKPKTKVYLPDGRRKLSKSKVERDRERMTKFIQKKSAALKSGVETESETNKKETSENST